MSWTPHGIEQLGALPEPADKPLPQSMPAWWYVEPIDKLDAARFAKLIELVRSQGVPGLSLTSQPIASWTSNEASSALTALHDLPQLRALVLDDTDTDGAALAALQLPALVRLYLNGTAVDDAAIAAVADRYPALEVLDIEDTTVGDAGAHAIGKLTELHAVNLASTQITDAGGAALASLGKLEIADLGNTAVGSATIAALRGLPLHELFIDRTRVRGEIVQLAPLAPQLVRFDASYTAHHFSDKELGWLAQATQLITIGASGSKLHDPLAKTLAALPTVREVRLADTEITAATIHAIAARTDLEEVDLAGTPVDDASAAALIAAPAMRLVRLDATPLSDAALAGSAGPALRELYITRTSIGDTGLAILARAPQLTGLGVGHSNVGDGGLARIAQLAELRTLVASSLHASPEAFAQLGRLAQLERLYVDHTHAGDELISALSASRTSLRVLHLDNTDVSDAALPALRQLSELVELTAGDSRLHAAIADLSAWPRLRTLSLTGLDLTDPSLAQLAARPSLAILDLSATDIRDPSPLTALPRLRTLGVAQCKLSTAGNAALKRLAARGVEVVR